MKEVKIDISWKKALDTAFHALYWESLASFVREEYKCKKVFPSPRQIFRAFDLCPFDKVKVVIMGSLDIHSFSYLTNRMDYLFFMSYLFKLLLSLFSTPLLVAISVELSDRHKNII